MNTEPQPVEENSGSEAVPETPAVDNAAQPEGQTQPQAAGTTPEPAEAAVDESRQASGKIRIGSQRDSAAPVAKPRAVEAAMENPIQLVEQEENEEPFADAVVHSDAGLGDDLDAEIEAALGGLSMDDIVAGAVTAEAELESGTRLQGTVSRIHGEHVFFKLNGQDEGIVSTSQFSTLPEPGTELPVIIRERNKDDGLYELAIPGSAVNVAEWADINEGDVIEAVVSGNNTGGLEVMVNKLRGFIPMSHIDRFRVDDVTQYLGKKLQCVVIEVNAEKKKLVVSRRAMLDREQEEKRAELMKTIEVGQLHDGIVTKLMDFGAFIDIGGMEGLAHISKLSWSRVAHPRDVLSEGQKVQVKIEKIDQDTGKMSLSYRDTLEDPWKSISEKFQPNEEVDGTVTRVAQFGAFIKLADGIEGLCHISELAHRRVVSVTSVCNEGDRVRVKILSIDPETQKMSLSIKATQQAPAPKEAVQQEEKDEPARPLAVPKRSEPLKGGLGRKSGGEDIGLNL
ncbi:MAG: S1 RNA-binding domain-containing protein [Planctomycetota bacterium]